MYYTNISAGEINLHEKKSFWQFCVRFIQSSVTATEIEVNKEKILYIFDKWGKTNQVAKIVNFGFVRFVPEILK